MQEYVEDNPITFNDIPRVMSDILKKCDLLEQSIEILHEEIRQSNQNFCREPTDPCSNRIH